MERREALVSKSIPVTKLLSRNVNAKIKINKLKPQLIKKNEKKKQRAKNNFQKKISHFFKLQPRKSKLYMFQEDIFLKMFEENIQKFMCEFRTIFLFYSK